MGTKKLNVGIIEDTEIHSLWLTELISEDPELNVSFCNRTGREGIKSAKSLLPDIVLIDFQLEDITGIEVSKYIKSYNPDIKTFILTAHTEVIVIDHLINNKNIDAIAIKGSSFFEENLALALKSVFNGQTYIDPSLLKKLRERKNKQNTNDLTKREFEIFVQVGLGKKLNDIADDLNVDLAHVRNIRSKIFKKIKGVDTDGFLKGLLENTPNSDNRNS